MNIHNDILGLIGNTPMVRINHLVQGGEAAIYAKLEGFNPGGSVKDRIALSMIEAAERDGRLKPGGTVIEPTSGNTGIGLAMVAAIKRYRLILTMSEAMTTERRQLLQAYGAELVLTDAARGMLGAVEKAEELYLANRESYFMPQQFENPANPDIHKKATAREIVRDLGHVPDAFVAGVGTGGTITGVGEAFKEKKKDCLIVAVEPAASAILSGGEPGRHRIAGIGAGFYPGVLNTKAYDEVITVTDDDALEMTRQLSLREGLLVGVSSGAAIWAALGVAKRLGRGKEVVVILPDRGERYLSTGLFSNNT